MLLIFHSNDHPSDKSLRESLEVEALVGLCFEEFQFMAQRLLCCRALMRKSVGRTCAGAGLLTCCWPEAGEWQEGAKDKTPSIGTLPCDLLFPGSLCLLEFPLTPKIALSAESQAFNTHACQAQFLVKL